MTKAICAALLLIPLAVACGSPDIPDPVGPEQPDLSTPGWSALSWPNAAGRFEDVYFVDEDYGWLVAPGGPEPGSIYRTMDGGARWERMFVDDGIVPWAVAFATPQIGWLGNLNFFLSEGAPLYETLDGGETWHDVSDRISGPVGDGMSGIFVLDPDNIFAVGRYMGPAFFMRSNDGGATWTSSDLAPLATGLIDVHFFVSNGIAVGGIGESVSAFQTVVLRTEDGGDSWRQVYRGQTEGRNAWKISFPTPSIGYVSTDGWGQNRGGNVLKTEDGGGTWREVAVGPTTSDHFNRLWGVGFISADTGWVAGSNEIYRTNDGGQSWSVSPFGRDVSRFRFLPSGIGYAGGPVVYRFNP